MKAIDITGKRFGRLVALYPSGSIAKLRQWTVKCDCDNEVIVQQIRLTTGTKTHCGCIPRADILGFPKGNKSPYWKGVGDISACRWAGIVKAARTRGIRFSVSLKHCWELFLAQESKCALSGVPLLFASSKREFADTTASLDRIDSSLGYVKGNIQWVHKDLNLMKSDHTEAAFVLWCRLVANFRGSREP